MANQDATIKRFSLRLSAALLDRLARVAEQEHRSINEQIIFMLEQQLVQREPEDSSNTPNA
jgi:hypothetical protein